VRVLLDAQPVFGPVVEMCEESELSELSPERAEPAIGDSGSRKMCVISVISVVRGCLACSILYKGAAELCGRRINLRLIR
jgi:hypothetical protein